MHLYWDVSKHFKMYTLITEARSKRSVTAQHYLFIYLFFSLSLQVDLKKKKI